MLTCDFARYCEILTILRPLGNTIQNLSSTCSELSAFSNTSIGLDAVDWRVQYNTVAKCIHFFALPWQFRMVENLVKAWHWGFCCPSCQFCFHFLHLTYILQPPPTLPYIFTCTIIIPLALSLCLYHNIEIDLFILVAHSRASNSPPVFFNTSDIYVYDHNTDINTLTLTLLP